MSGTRSQVIRRHAARVRAAAEIARRIFRRVRLQVATTRVVLRVEAARRARVPIIAGGAGPEIRRRPGRTRVVLVVDDHEDTRQMYVQFLEAMGLKAFEATTCAAALAISGKGGIDVVVLDRRLPDGDGADVCRALKSDLRTRNLPVIVLSGRAQDDSIGADAYLVKPVIPDDLLNEIERLVG
jgi:CheY-like chemotaxis protein